MFNIGFVVYADDTVYTCGDYTYTINEDNTATVTAYNGNDAVVIMPDSLDGHIISALGRRVFFNNSNMTSITVPLTVKNIGEENFASCSELTEVKGIDNVEVVSDYCFNYSKKLAQLPKLTSLVSIGSYVFGNCISMKEFYFPATVKTIKSRAFLDTDMAFLMDENNPNFTLIDGVIYTKSLTEAVRGSTAITECTIPNSVTTIRSSAFSYCKKLRKLYGGEGVKTVGGDAFEFCNVLESIDSLCSLEYIGTSAFSFAITKDLDLPETVTALDSEAFYKCRLKIL